MQDAQTQDTGSEMHQLKIQPKQSMSVHRGIPQSTQYVLYLGMGVSEPKALFRLGFSGKNGSKPHN